jgi:hypothetical protein
MEAADTFWASWNPKKAQVPLAGPGLNGESFVERESEGGAQSKLQDAWIQR